MTISTLRQLWPSFVQGERLIDGRDLLNLAGLMTSSQFGLTALAGGGATTTVICNRFINEVSVCATNGDSVILPQAIPGRTINIINDGAATLAVFPLQSNPATGVADAIIPSGSAASTTSANQLTTATAAYYCISPGIWKQALQS
jgi:hypothetical protein